MADFEIEDVPYEEEKPKPVEVKRTVNLIVPDLTEEEKLNSKHGTYIGTLDHLRGYPVRIMNHPVSDNLLLVKFDLVDDREQTIFCYSWRTWLASDFEVHNDD